MVSGKWGLMERAIAETPVGIVDIETTGLNTEVDRVVEISIVTVAPGQPPKIAFDTLIRPDRPIGGTEIHGITEQDVADAPRFCEIAENLVNELRGCAVGTYNAFFDIGFLEEEFHRAGLEQMPPYLCLMYLRPMIGLGDRCSLEDACQAHEVDYVPAHQTAANALAAAQLYTVYLQAMKRRRLKTFKDLASLKDYKFVQSFYRDLLLAPAAVTNSTVARSKSRNMNTLSPNRWPVFPVRQARPHQDALHSYWEQLKSVICDYCMNITEKEVTRLAQKRKELSLTAEEVRNLHARTFADMVSSFVDDKRLDDRSCLTVQRFYQWLRRLDDDLARDG